MSYLLMQIFICLLIAGLIGLLIGWLLRGGCKDKLFDNDKKWNNELDETNTTWKNQVNGLMDDNQKNKDSSSLHMSTLKGELETVKTNLEVQELNWKNKLNDDTISWENRLTLLTKEHARVKASLLLSENKVKDFEKNITELNIEKEDLARQLSNSNSSWEQKVQALVSTGNNKDKDLSEVKESFSKLEAESNEINSKLRNAKVSNLSMEDKLKASENEWNIKYNKVNSNWEKKAQTLAGDNEVKWNEINLELTDTKSKLKMCQSEALEEKLKEKLKEETKIEDTSSQMKEVVEESSSLKRNSKKLENKGRKNYAKLKTSKHIKSTNEEVSSITNKDTSGPELLTQARNGKKDNLTLVRGIGKVLEERLNKLGIYHFDQVASWSKKQQSWMDERMSFPGRIGREEWVTQAAELAIGEETEFSKRVKKGDVPSSKQK